jgi:hypothetical protein
MTLKRRKRLGKLVSVRKMRLLTVILVRYAISLRAEREAPPHLLMNSKRARDPCAEEAMRGRCCKKEGCAQEEQGSYVDFLRDDAFPTP